MAKKVKLIFIIASALLMILIYFNNSSASFTLSNYSIYGLAPGEYLSGEIKMNFNNENSDSRFISGQNSMKLVDFLDENGADYTCNPSGCENYYSISNPRDNKSLSMNYGEEKTFALSVNNSNLDDFELQINGNFAGSCLSPLEVSFFDDREILFYSNKFTNAYSCKYESGTGCYSNGAETNLGQGSYCEKMKLLPNKKFEIGAWVKKGAAGWREGMIKAAIYSNSGSKIQECSLPEPSSNGGEISCKVELARYIPNIQNFYVCISSDSNTDYKIKSETNSPCGANRIPPIINFTSDYYIFARGARFAGILGLRINNSEFLSQGNSDEITSEIESRIDRRYNSNCSSGCTIPIRIISHSNSSVMISDISINSRAEKIYDSAVTSAKISSGLLTLELDFLGFAVPKKVLELYFNTQKLFSINLSIASSIDWIAPSYVYAGVSTKFIVSSSKNFSRYYWYFGDGESSESTENFAYHIYSGAGTFEIEVEAEDSDGNSNYKSAEVNVSFSKQALNASIYQHIKNADFISGLIGNEWYSSRLREMLRINEKKDNLARLSLELSRRTDGNYLDIIENLSAESIPRIVWESENAELDLSFSEEMIDLEALRSIGAGEYDIGDEYSIRENIVKEFNTKYGGKVNYKVISAEGDSGREDLITAYTLSVKGNGRDSFLIIDVPKDEIKFKEDYNSIDAGERYGFMIPSLEKEEYQFVVNGKLDYPEEIAYVSPEFSKLGSDSAYAPLVKNLLSWWMILIYIITAMLLSFSVYLIMRKVHYENMIRKAFMNREYFLSGKAELFPGKNDLYNLVTFINNALLKNISGEEITSNLLKRGWISDEINYAFNNRDYLDKVSEHVRKIAAKGMSIQEITSRLSRVGWHSEEISYILRDKSI